MTSLEILHEIARSTSLHQHKYQDKETRIHLLLCTCFCDPACDEIRDHIARLQYGKKQLADLANA